MSTLLIIFQQYIMDHLILLQQILVQIHQMDETEAFISSHILKKLKWLLTATQSHLSKDHHLKILNILKDFEKRLAISLESYKLTKVKRKIKNLIEYAEKISAESKETNSQHFPSDLLINSIQQSDLNFALQTDHSLEAQTIKDILDNRQQKNRKKFRKFEASLQQIFFKKVIDNPELDSEKVHLQSYQCLGCCEYFTEGTSLLSFHQPTVILNYEHDELVLQNQIKQAVCSLLNDGGGFIIINRGNSSYVEQIQIEDESEKVKMNNFIFSILQSKFIYCENTEFRLQWKFEAVRVLKSPYLQYATVHENAIIYRLIIKGTASGHSLYYLKKSVNGFKTSYHLHLRQKNETLILKGRAEYELIHELFSNPIKSREICTSGCCYSNEGRRRIISKYIKQATFIEQKLQVNFKNNSIIICSTSKYNRLIDVLAAILNEKKMKFAISKPYQRFRSKSCREIWLISHEDNFVKIQEIVSKNVNKLSLINITKNILIDLTLHEIKGRVMSFEKTFKLKFPTSKLTIIKEIPKFEMGMNFYYVFENIADSVFAFCFLENMRIRVTFVTDKNVFGLDCGETFLNQLNTI